MGRPCRARCTCGRHRGRPRRTRGELLAHLRRIADYYGRTPSEPVIDRHGPPSHMTYVRRFGGMRAAQRAAGLLPNVQRGQDP